MTATISKEFAFSASHVLKGLPTDHPCSRLHGHNYIVKVELSGPVNDVGFVIDYRELGFVKAYLDDELDHRHLNDVLPFNPTAENMARWLCENLVESTLPIGRLRVAVSVSETPKTWATWATT